MQKGEKVPRGRFQPVEVLGFVCRGCRAFLSVWWRRAHCANNSGMWQHHCPLHACSNRLQPCCCLWALLPRLLSQYKERKDNTTPAAPPKDSENGSDGEPADGEGEGKPTKTVVKKKKYVTKKPSSGDDGADKVGRVRGARWWWWWFVFVCVGGVGVAGSVGAATKSGVW